MKLLVLFYALTLTALCVQCQDKHFAGGSMSFRFVSSTQDNYKIKLTIVTGWTIGQGPCGTACSLQDVGRTTEITRNNMLSRYGDTYFGNWTAEVNYVSGFKKNTSFVEISDYVKSALRGKVAAVNEHMNWEQEIAEVLLDIDPASRYTDISMSGRYWREFDYEYPGDVKYRLQVKALPRRRNDTGEPNNSPVAMFKPVYKLLLNSETTIKLSTSDIDDDIVVCDFASFVSAGALKRLRTMTVNKDCSIVIKTDEADGFTDGGWGVVALTIKDFNRNAIAIEGMEDRPAGDTQRSLSNINVQFMIQTLQNLDEPVFVSPTRESQHIFTVYAGAEVAVPLYAKPRDQSSGEIQSFYMRSIPRQDFMVPEPQIDTKRRSQNVKHTMVTWRPERADIGIYVISPLVTDISGNDGPDRNYKLIVKDVRLTTPKSKPTVSPHFAFLPGISDITCLRDSTCSFPIYTATKQAGDRIMEIKEKFATIPGIKISQPVQITKDGKDVYLSDITFTSNFDGPQNLCVIALDNHREQSGEECLNITIQAPDPCEKNFCQNNGKCQRYQDSFACSCPTGYTGKLCEKVIDPCESQPCANGATCYETLNIGQVFCQCASGFQGTLCETNIDDCKPASCSYRGICKDLVNDIRCDCFSGYTGDRCQAADSICIQKGCINGGVCTVHDNMAVCNCPLGLTGDLCQSDNKETGIPLHGHSNAGKSAFILPTPVNGARISCTVGSTCHVPFYVHNPTDSPMPSVKLGPLSPDTIANISNPVTDATAGLPNVLYSRLSVSPSKPGAHHVCVEIATGSLEVDSVCYTVNTTVTTNLHGVTGQSLSTPKFLEPSLPDQSAINCYNNQPCHILFHTESERSGNCSLISQSPEAIILDTAFTNGVCHSDVLFLSPRRGNRVCLMIGLGGEERCFTILEITSKTDPCRNKPCKYKGSCINMPSETPTFMCVCHPGYKGHLCEIPSPCYGSPCENGGTCKAQGTKYHCQCLSKYTGENCEHDVRVKVDFSAKTMVTVLATTAGVLLGITGVMGGVILLRKCASRCSANNAIEDAPVDSKTSDDNEQEEEIPYQNIPTKADIHYALWSF